MKISSSQQIQRLKRLYGDVQRLQNNAIASYVTGKSVLDVGCGYGSLAKDLKDSGKFNYIMGIDMDKEAIDIGRTIHPGVELNVMDVFEVEATGRKFDTVIFRESIHHLDVDKMLSAIKRICVKEIIVFDPNPNFIVRVSRLLIAHKDEEVTPDMLVGYCRKHGLTVQALEFRDVVAFPLSGGFVGLELCPNIKILKRIVLWKDNVLNSFLKTLHVQKYFCWRYILKATIS